MKGFVHDIEVTYASKHSPLATKVVLHLSVNGDLSGLNGLIGSHVSVLADRNMTNEEKRELAFRLLREVNR